MAATPYDSRHLEQYLGELEKHPHLKDYENKAIGMVNHMRSQGVDAEYLGSHHTKGGIMHHEDGTAETLEPHVAHSIRIRDKEFTTPHPKAVAAGRTPKWIHIAHGTMSHEMERWLTGQTLRGLTHAAEKNRKN